VDANFELKEAEITVTAESEFQVQQMMEILKSKLVKRNVDIMSMQEGDVVESGKKATMKVTMQQGIDADMGRKLVKLIKDKKLKVQTAIQGDKLRVTGKKRDDLQEVIAMLREAKLEIPLQYNNFRD
jgi:cyclic-di-GMP-binding protein